MAIPRIFVPTSQLFKDLTHLSETLRIPVSLHTEGGGYDLAVQQEGDYVQLTLTSDKRTLIEVPNQPDGHQALAQTLKGWLHWNRIWELDQEEGETPIQLEVYPAGAAEPHPGESWTAEIWQQHQKIPFTVKVRNRTEHTQHISLLYLTDRGGIQPVPLQERDSQIGAGEVRELLTASAFLESADIDHQSERLIAIGSPLPLDLGSWAQPSFRQPPADPVELMLNRRRISRFAVHVIRGQGKVGTEAFSMANGKIEVQGHPNLKVSLGLSTTGPNTRSLSGNPVTSALQATTGVVINPLGTATRSMRGVPDTLEISGIDATAREQVRQRPLVLNMTQPMGAREGMVPLVFDGEFLLPAGRALTGESGKLRLELDYLPEESTRTRSIGQALKFYFVRAVFDRPTLQLQRAIYHEDGTVERTEEGLAKAIKGAEKILIVVHGIIGNTQEMAESVRFAVEERRYDLVLTVDYENLSTPISETARRFKERLLELGADAKTLDIMAHSMGGLVSRWMIEREGGDRFIRRLLMLGTPNGGSAFSMLAPIIPGLIAIAANITSPVLGSLVFAMQWLNDRKKINRTLSDMDKDSNMLLELNTSEAVKTPYAIVAGDVTRYQSTAEGWFGRLMDKAMIGVGNKLYKSGPNDIAVSVPGIFHLPSGKTAFCHELPTHHLIYFNHAPSLQWIQQFLRAGDWAMLARMGVLSKR